MSMTDDDLNALLAAWAKEDGSVEMGGGEIGEAESPSDTFSALTSGGANANLAKWANKWQGGAQEGGGGGWNQQQSKGGWGGQQQGGKGGGSWGKNKSVAQKIAAGEPVYCGKVKTFDKEKNRGYIVCEEICSSTGMDVYVYGDVLAQAGGAPGDSVAFFVHWSQAGQPQASAPMVRIAAGDATGDYAMKGEYKSGPGGAGFIVNEVMKEFFGRDVFVNREFCNGLQVGQTVAFNAGLNAQKYPQVEKMEACGPDWEPTLGDLTMTRTDPSVFSSAVKGGCKGGCGGGKDSWKGDGGDGASSKGAGKGGKEGKIAMMMSMMQSILDGGWDDGWGDDGGKGGWGGGESWGKEGGGKGSWDGGKGKKFGGGGGGGGPPAPSGETFYGVIKSFNEKNNFGFIASEQIQEKYNGVDCFFHGKFMQGHNIGDMVEFDVGLNAKGQPQAMAIRPLTLPDVDEEPAMKMMKLG